MQCLGSSNDVLKALSPRTQQLAPPALSSWLRPRIGCFSSPTGSVTDFKGQLSFILLTNRLADAALAESESRFCNSLTSNGADTSIRATMAHPGATPVVVVLGGLLTSSPESQGRANQKCRLPVLLLGGARLQRVAEALWRVRVVRNCAPFSFTWVFSAVHWMYALWYFLLWFSSQGV